MYLFTLDLLFVAYLLILIGGLSTTYCLYKLAVGEFYCLYKLAVGEFALSDRKKLDYLQLELREEKERREKTEKELKKLIIENYTEILKLQNLNNE
jgi:hypothetical protein